MIPIADQKAGLARLDNVSKAVEQDQPAITIELAMEATRFYDQLHPETPDEILAVEYGLDAITNALSWALLREWKELHNDQA